MQDDILQNTGRSKFSWKVFGLIMTAVAVASLVFGIIMAVVKNDTKTPGVSENNNTGLVDNETRINPVLSAEAPAAYVLNVTSAIEEGSDGVRYLTIDIEDGEIVSCDIEVATMTESTNIQTCQINGVDGKIYKAVQLYGDSIKGFNPGLGLIMADGTVEYIPVANHTGNTFEVKETLKINGYVVDGIDADVKNNKYNEDAPSDWSTLFVLNDGKALKFDSSMVTVDSSMDEHLDEGEPLDEGEEL